MEINAKELRNRLSSLIDEVEDGQEIVISRRGKKVARLVPLHVEKKLPSLKEFRSSITIKGRSLSSIVAGNREEERY